MKVRELYDRLGQLIRDGYEDYHVIISNEFDEQILYDVDIREEDEEIVLYKKKESEEFIMKKIKVLWFSRHEMSAEQRAALGDVEIVQINKTIQSAQELKTEIEDCDIIAVVAPIGLQEQFLRLAGDKPVITAVNDRRIIKNDDGSEDKVDFHFVKWERLLEIKVVKEDFPNKTLIVNR